MADAKSDLGSAYSNFLRRYYLELARREKQGLSGVPSAKETETFLDELRSLIEVGRAQNFKRAA